MISEQAHLDLLETAMGHKRRAIARRQRIFELIDVQYGMVYDIAHVIDDLVREAEKMHADGAHASAVNHRLHAHALEQLCPDQEVMDE